MNLSLLTTLLPWILELVKLLLGLPKDHRAAYIQAIREYNAKINAALEKAKNEKDPSDLSALLSQLPDNTGHGN